MRRLKKGVMGALVCGLLMLNVEPVSAPSLVAVTSNVPYAEVHLSPEKRGIDEVIFTICR